jgi:hypothetical protein
MNRSALAVVAALALGAQGCGLFKHDVSITLNPDPVITIQSNPGSTTCNPSSAIEVSPASAGKDYTDNKDKIDSSVLQQVVLDVTRVYADNGATTLLSSTLTFTNKRTQEQVVLTLGAPISLGLNSSHTLTELSPNPATDAKFKAFVDTMLKNGDAFTVVANCQIDKPIVHIDLKLHLKMRITLNP